MNRNVNDIAARVPTPHFPRSRFPASTKRRQTQKHGLLTPFFIAPVYPGDTWDVTLNKFTKMDISAKVPLDHVYEDTYFFFVPFRIIDQNFPKVLGASDSAYDPTAETAHIPQTKLTTSSYNAARFARCLLGYLNCNVASVVNNAVFSVTSYPLMAYWKIWNDFFRDETFDSEVAFGNLADNANAITIANDLVNPGQVNKFSDYFTRAMMTSQRGPEVTIPLGTTAPVDFIMNDGEIEIRTSDEATSILPLYADGTDVDNNSKLTAVADLKNATAASINQLRLSFAIQSLYERRAMYGTRYTSVLRGQWGLEVPDGLLQRPEYLGGSRESLNNIPVLNTGTTADQGKPVGSSSTLTGGDKVFKTMLEYGLIIGLSTFRIKHSYGQGKDPMLWDLKDGLDLFNPVFANIGYMPIKNSEIYFDIASAEPANDEVFGYQEAWQRLRTFPDTIAGYFSPILASDVTFGDLVKLWTYADVYASLPQLSSSWLKEGHVEVDRGLTGRLLPIFSDSYSTAHEYMCEYVLDIKVTRILPSHSVPVSLIGRL